MTDGQKATIINIIAGVETGSQIYGNRRYNAYSLPNPKIPGEKTITVGYPQFYGNSARDYYIRLYNAVPDIFPGWLKEYLSEDWESLKWQPTDAQGDILKGLETTPEGKALQDTYISDLVNEYEKNAAAFGVTSIRAVAMWCEIEHLGGIDAVKRIFERAEKPYTPETIFTSLLIDQTDPPAGAKQPVGCKLFQSRHECCRDWANKYFEGDDKMTESEIRQSVVNTAIKYLGCNEADGSHRKIIDIYNGVKPLPRSYTVKYTDSWCATFVSAVAILTGNTGVIPRECGCPEMIELFKEMGRWVEDDAYVPSPADVIFYDWQDSGSGDDTGTAEHVGYVVSLSNGMIKVIEGNKSDAVAYRVIAVNGRFIRGFGVPDYASKAAAGTDAGTSTLNETSQWDGVVKSVLNVRKWAGTQNDVCSFSPLAAGDVVGVCDTVTAADGSAWYYIIFDGKHGFVSADYITKQQGSDENDSRPVMTCTTDNTPVYVDTTFTDIKRYINSGNLVRVDSTETVYAVDIDGEKGFVVNDLN